MSDAIRWDERYRTRDVPWDTGRPSPELQRVLGELRPKPGRAIEFGCGTGTNSVWLAEQGFEVTGIDLSEEAIKLARQRARDANVNVNFVVGDVLAPPRFDQPFLFFFDRGCYHAVRRTDPLAYGAAVLPLLAPGAVGLILAGNAKEPHDPGPPVVSEREIRDELGRFFDIRQLREFRFDPTPGVDENFLAWSILVAAR
jgi:methyl halide transferase